LYSITMRARIVIEYNVPCGACVSVLLPVSA